MGERIGGRWKCLYCLGSWLYIKATEEAYNGRATQQSCLESCSELLFSLLCFLIFLFVCIKLTRFLFAFNRRLFTCFLSSVIGLHWENQPNSNSQFHIRMSINSFPFTDSRHEDATRFRCILQAKRFDRTVHYHCGAPLFCRLCHFACFSWK